MFSRFFIHRPIFASVLSIIITLAGGDRRLGAAGGPVSGHHAADGGGGGFLSGANAKVVADTVAAPIEQQVNGVEGMLYMSSQCTNDGQYTLTVTFKLGVDLNMAQVLVQNRVALAQPILPDLVHPQGRDGEEEVAQRLDDRQPLLARRQPRQSLSEQLRHDPAPRRVGSAAGRRRHYLPGPARLQHAALAGSPGNDLAQPHLQRRRVGHSGAERPGGRRPDRATARAQRPDVPVHHDHARAAGRHRPVCRHDPQDRLFRPRRPHERRRPASSSAPRNTIRPAPSTAGLPWPCRSTSCPAPTP